MSHVSSIDDEILNLLPDSLDSLRIGDIGCGYGAWGFQIRLKKNGKPILFGVDIWKPYLQQVKKTGLYDHLICAEVGNLPFKANAFNIVLACELVEHLKFEEALQALQQMDCVCNGRIILSTPYGFLKNISIDGNPYKNHRSGWKPLQLEKLAFKWKTVEDRNFLPEKVKMLLAKVKKIFPDLLTLREIIAWKDKNQT